MSRRVLILVALAAALARCGGGGGSNGPHIALDLKGGSNETATACGSQHHYAVFRRGQTINYSGTVKPVPSRRWKVKVKIKTCRGGTFQELAKVEATRSKATGRFSGSLPAGGPGRYFARVSLYEGGVQTARGDKRYFVVR
jgi:hypothetical protein